MSEPKLVPGLSASVLTMASVTWRRLLRGRAIIVALVIAFLPVAFAFADRRAQADDEIFVFEMLVAAVLAPMFVAASIGEDIEERTTAYLWSRPVSRSAIVAGKLLALVPVVAAIVVGSWVLSAQVAWAEMPNVRSIGALALCIVALSVVSAGIATLAPKHGMALAICYVLFFDSPLGVMPAKLQELSVTHQIRALSGLWRVENAVQTPLVALAALAAIWGFVAVARIRRLEA